MSAGRFGGSGSLNQYPAHLQRAAESIQAVRTALKDAICAEEQLRKAFERAGDALLVVDSAGLPTGKLGERLERLQMLRRSMEIGAFGIQAEHDLDAAWKAMP